MRPSSSLGRGTNYIFYKDVRNDNSNNYVDNVSANVTHSYKHTRISYYSGDYFLYKKAKKG